MTHNHIEDNDLNDENNTNEQSRFLHHLTKVPTNTTVLFFVCMLFGLFSVAELSAAVVVSSLSLLADAITMVIDAITYCLNMYAERRKQKGASVMSRLKLEFYIPLCSVIALICVNVYAIKEAVEVLSGDSSDNDDATKDTTMLTFALVNLAIDILSLTCFARINQLLGFSSTDDISLDSIDFDRLHEHKSNTNMCSAYTHVLADTMRSVAVIAAAIISLTNSNVNSDRSDAYGALMVTTVTFVTTVPLFRGLWQKWQLMGAASLARPMLVPE